MPLKACENIAYSRRHLDAKLAAVHSTLEICSTTKLTI